MALQPFVWPWPLFSFLILFTVGRTPWMRDQSVARPLPTHSAAQTQNKRTQTSIPPVGFEPTAPSEDSYCLRPRGHCDRRLIYCFTVLCFFLNATLRRLRWGRSRKLCLPLDVSSMKMQPLPLSKPNLITYSSFSS
jgi:hypothetical protein